MLASHCCMCFCFNERRLKGDKGAPGPPPVYPRPVALTQQCKVTAVKWMGRPSNPAKTRSVAIEPAWLDARVDIIACKVEREQNYEGLLVQVRTFKAGPCMRPIETDADVKRKR